MCGHLSDLEFPCFFRATARQVKQTPPSFMFPFAHIPKDLVPGQDEEWLVLELVWANHTFPHGRPGKLD